MPRNPFACAALVSVFILLSGHLQAETAASAVESAEPAGNAAQHESLADLVSQWEQKSQAAYDAGKWVSFYTANMKLRELLPFEPRYVINIVRACGLLDRKSTAYAYMLQLQQQGVSYDFSSTDDTLNIRDTEAYHYINNLMIDAGKTAGEGAVAFTLPKGPSNYSAIAWDGNRDRFLIGSTGDGAVLSVAENGATDVLLKASKDNGILSVTGLEVDVGNNRLWLTSAPGPGVEADAALSQRQSALFEIDLATLEVLGRYDLPADGLEHRAVGLAVSRDQHVYVIDGTHPMIYRKSPGESKLEAFFGSSKMLRFVDIAVTADNDRIFVADAARGILVIDPAADSAAMLSGPETLNLGGILGMEFFQEQLFVIQGGFEPQRVMRLAIDPSGGVAQTASPMAVALPEFDRPGHGVIRGDNLYYFANTAGNSDNAAVVMSTPLQAGVEAGQRTQEELNNAMKPRNQ